jgi:hypothetical protein
MERAKRRLLMNVKCKLLAMAGGFTKATSQALPPEVLFPNFCTSTVCATPATWGVRSCPEVRLGHEDMARRHFSNAGLLKKKQNHGRFTGNVRHADPVSMRHESCRFRSCVVFTSSQRDAHCQCLASLLTDSLGAGTGSATAALRGGAQSVDQVRELGNIFVDDGSNLYGEPIGRFSSDDSAVKTDVPLLHEEMNMN